MAYTSIPDEWREVGKAVKKELIDTIHENLEDLNGRIGGVEVIAGGITLTNGLVEKERDVVPLGTIIWSNLSESQFNAENSDGDFALCDGATMTGTDLLGVTGRSARPDLRGRFLRMKAHGTGSTRNPAGDVALDTNQSDDNRTHTHAHTITATGSFATAAHYHGMRHVHTMFQFLNSSPRLKGYLEPAFPEYAGGTLVDFASIGGGGGTGTSINFATTSTVPYNSYLYTSRAIAPDIGIGVPGDGDYTDSMGDTDSQGGSTPGITGSITGTGTESRPLNITENAFIKTERNYVTIRDGVLIFRSPQLITINQVVLSPTEGNGTAGTLILDVKKGPLGAITTSIFTTQPELSYTDTTAQAGVINPLNASVNSGEYVQVDITSVQSKLENFHLFISASPG